MLLDEPSNHLDLPSVERLEAALVGVGCAFVLVTHDAQLAQASCRRVWRIERGRLTDAPLEFDGAEDRSVRSGPSLRLMGAAPPPASAQAAPMPHLHDTLFRAISTPTGTSCAFTACAWSCAPLPQGSWARRAPPPARPWRRPPRGPPG
jgi:energy-coupling factor transporter ATP-binding protein EcfA2